MRFHGCWKSKKQAPPMWARQDLDCGYESRKTDPSCKGCAHNQPVVTNIFPHRIKAELKKWGWRK